jgi:hypothetical protein
VSDFFSIVSMFAGVYVLRVMPDWAAALTVAVVVGIVAMLMASMGLTRWNRYIPSSDDGLRI